MALQTFTAGQVLTAAQMTSLQADRYNQTVSTKVASYVLAAGDVGTRVVMNSSSATSITVNTSIFAAGDTLWIHNIGSGTCTITAGTATVSTSGSLALGQNQGGTLYFTSAGVAIFFPTVQTSAQGLTLINTTSFSAVASQSINDVFSATYNKYLISIDQVGSADTTLSMRLRVSGADNSSSNYYYSGTSIDSPTAATLSLIKGDPLTLYQMGFTTISGTNVNTTLTNPFSSSLLTVFNSTFGHGIGTDAGSGYTGGHFNATTSFTGFTLIPGAGTMTGTVSVYGYNK